MIQSQYEHMFDFCKGRCSGVRIENVISRYGDKFHGDVSVALQSRTSRSGVRAILKNPKIEETPFGVRLISGSSRVDIDYRDARETDTLTEDDFSLEYDKSGLSMSIAFMGDPA